MYSRTFYFAIYFSLFYLIVCDNLILDPCEQYEKCDLCIRNSYKCSWCAMEGFKGKRCKTLKLTSKDWCPSDLKNPISYSNVSDDKPFSSDPNQVIQIRPQGFKLKLRPGEPVHFNFSYQGAKDYPVDIYFLIDASKTMEEVKATTAKETENIYRTMSKLTSKVMLGMGTFIDKNALPFTEKTNSNLTYSFKNHRKLRNEYKELKEIITNTPIGRNFDDPEGGLDALAQVLVCKDEIEWRNNSRKIVILFTDGPYHAAGDGQLAGIVRPYDGKCYTENGIYKKELQMDYPSVGVINTLAAKEEIIVIFGINNKVQSDYKILSNAIRSSDISIFDNKPFNARILENIYKKITENIKLKVESIYEKYIDIKFSPDCLNDNRNEDCKVEKEQQKHFSGTITLRKYIEADNIRVDLKVAGITEKLTLNIDIVKECYCVNENNSSLCSKSGTHRCGICECDRNRYGDKCQCTATSGSTISNNSTCIAADHSDLCSGRGICHCGTCQCGKGYDGQYCEYNQRTCYRGLDDTMCSGNGQCISGVCVCNEEWTGHFCDCDKSKESCNIDNKVGKRASVLSDRKQSMPSINICNTIGIANALPAFETRDLFFEGSKFQGQSCNNRGNCSCGRCECDPLSQWDVRSNQDEFCRVSACTDCHSRQCRALESCVLCLHAENEYCPDCDKFINSNVTQISPSYTADEEWKTCDGVKVALLCYTYFIYRYNIDNYGIELIISEDVDCVQNYYVFGGTFLASLIIFGLVTLIAWKVITDLNDRREYERFIKEKDEDEMNVCKNPNYVPSTVTYSNVAFYKK